MLRISELNNLKKTGEPVILDDKKLLDAFANTPTADEAEKFITALLKTRFLFDRYIIKREHDESNDSKWCLKRRKTYETSSSDSYVGTFENTEQLVMAQSMFHVSYPTRNYKYWLNAALAYLSNSSANLSGEDLLKYFETLSDRFFFHRFAAKNPGEYDTMLKNDAAVEGVSSESLKGKFTYTDGIHTFVFNRLDYLLWKLKKLDASSQFVFTFKSSVEHVSPQTNDESNTEDNRISEEKRDHFGNLALVSASFNSSASNKSFKEKKEAFNAKKRPESLKLALIYQYDTWTDKEAKAHEEAMLEILCQKKPYGA